MSELAVPATNPLTQEMPVNTKPIAIWLLAICLMIFLMVAIGGITRLTESGLSITEWKPVTGAIPPLTELAWEEEFKKYQQIPEYQVINRGMNLEEFKQIYFWEYLHRLWGRLIGLVFAVPFLWFLIRRQLQGRMALACFGLFILGGLQGLVGWWMVKSGLSIRTDVSQYRLAAHLTLAILIFIFAFHLALKILIHDVRNRNRIGSRIRWLDGFLVLLLLQVVFGALVAGTDAGFAYNTWPDMDGTLLPPGLYQTSPFWLSALEDVTTIQFNHRTMAYMILAYVLMLLWRVRNSPSRIEKSYFWGLFNLILFQAILGIATLLSSVAIFMAVPHQLGVLVIIAYTLTMRRRLDLGHV